MYAVTVSEPFVAQHALTVPEPGAEGEWHSHRYEAEVRLRGESLDEHGYLVDIEEVRAALSAAVARYRDTTLNDLPEFEGRNPSAERLARQLCERFCDRVEPDGVERVALWLAEDDDDAVTYERPA